MGMPQSGTYFRLKMLLVGVRGSNIYCILSSRNSLFVQQTGCACRETDGFFCFNVVIPTTTRSEINLLCKVLITLNYFEYDLSFRVVRILQ